jgi:hypothetical protein
MTTWAQNTSTHNHFVQELGDKRVITLQYFQATDMLTDGFTKPRTGALLKQFADGIRLRNEKIFR